jgi:superfamily II DNA or RNA helicase
MIKIEKLNESYIRVFSDQSTEQELSQFFTFEVPGARFTPKYKARLWDGKLRLYNLQTKTLYSGLQKYVETYAQENDLELKTFEKDKTTLERSDLIGYIDWLKLHGKGKPIDARDYQIDAIHKAINDHRVLLLSPTASGKSLIIYTLLRYHIEHKRKCIIIVPTTSLVEQLVSDFKDYSSANGWNVDKNCQMLYSGFSKVFERNCLVTTWQSIYKQPQAWFEQFDVAFGDEAHLFKAISLTSVMSKMTNVKYRIGTTGTIDNSKVHSLVLEGIFGPLYKVITTKQLMETQQVTELKITCLMLKYDDVIRQSMRNIQYQDEMKFITAYEPRNRFIRNLALNCKGNTLVLFQMVEKHGKILYEMIKERAAENRKVFFIYGGTDTEDREEARKLVEDQSDAIIIASYGVFSTGINIPSIENVIFASPSKSKIRNLQSIGRGLRLKDGKTSCNLYDISDDLSWKSRKNHTLNHMVERLKIYAAEQFDYKIVEVKID